VRTCAPARRYGFAGFSPFTRPRVIAVAEGIPYATLCGGDVETLYRLKGEVLAAGIADLLGIEMPVFPKRRFQQGAASSAAFEQRLRHDPDQYRRHFLALHAGTARPGA
jgi:asparagine synthase (glutamine-hydrolysing)